MTESCAILPAGALVLTASACASLLDLVADPDRLAALSPEGSQAASAIRFLGAQHARAEGGTIAPVRRDQRARSARDDELLDAEGAATYLRCSVRAVRGWAVDGRLHGRRVGCVWAFTFSDLDRFREVSP